MWQEARKQEKKIRGIMIDYRKRAERRTAYYQKMRLDPHQLLRIYGQKCKFNIDTRHTIDDAQLVPWQGDSTVLIDRFDVRSHLDLIPEIQHESAQTEKKDSLEFQCDYERYRTLVQIEATGASEEAYLKQLAIEEMYGKKQAEIAKLEKEQRAKMKASFGFKYDDSSVLSGDSDNEDNDSDLSDIDISVDVMDLTEDQRQYMDNLATNYGTAEGYYCAQLTAEKKEQEFAKRLEEEEEERSKLSGRKGKRARRNLRERQKASRGESPPLSYAVKKSPTYDPYSPPEKGRVSSSSCCSSSPEGAGKIEYITEFGEVPAISDKSSISPSRKSKVNQEKHGSHKSRRRSSDKRRSRSKSHRRTRSRSRDRDRRRHSHHKRESDSDYHKSNISRSRSRSKRDHSKSRSRSHSRSRGNGSRSRSRSERDGSKSQSRRSKSRDRGRRRRSHRSRSGTLSGPESRSHSRSKSRSKSPREGREIESISKKLEIQPTKKKRLETGSTEKTKLAPQDRLKLRMQKMLNKQFKDDKKEERKRVDQKEKERLDREQELDEIQRKWRQRERDKYSRNRSSSKSPPTRGWSHRRPSRSRSKSRSSSKSPRTRAYEELGWTVK